jgi:hypothetical protein
MTGLSTPSSMSSCSYLYFWRIMWRFNATCAYVRAGERWKGWTGALVFRLDLGSSKTEGVIAKVVVPAAKDVRSVCKQVERTMSVTRSRASLQSISWELVPPVQPRGKAQQSIRGRHSTRTTTFAEANSNLASAQRGYEEANLSLE